jgi:hypothetical protein
MKKSLPLALSVWLLLLGVLATTAAAQAPSAFTSKRLNRTFPDAMAQIAPIQWGGMTITLTSPQSSVTIHDHKVELAPGQGERTHRAKLWVDFSGGGDLIADVESATGTPQRFTDKVKIPRQQLRLEALARVSKTTDGYVVTPLELPAAVTVAIESNVGANLVGLCEGLAKLPFMGAACANLEQRFENVDLPLAPPGESFFVPASELTADEKRQIDGYLGKHR